MLRMVECKGSAINVSVMAAVKSAIVLNNGYVVTAFSNHGADIIHVAAPAAVPLIVLSCAPSVGHVPAQSMVD